jgi:hypothetical protein
MSFVHVYLLGGLSLLAVPLLVHLALRERPRRLLFPAFRFLQQTYRSNRRKLRFQHLLLLLLRLLVVAALCLALARPRLYSDLPSLTGNQKIAAVLVFDTSPSMEYTVADRTRLDEAKRRALELIDELPDGSRVAVLDSAQPGGEFLDQPARMRERINSLQIQPANGPLTRQLDSAYKLFRDLEAEFEGADELPPRYLYLFSDRCRLCWNAAEAKRLPPPEGVNVFFVDVGVEKPRDLSIDRVEVEPRLVPPGGTVRVRVTVRTTGDRADNEITCQFDNDPTLERRPVRLEAGQSQIVLFERRASGGGPEGLKEGFHQVVVRLGTSDALAGNNVAFATFAVRATRQVLTIADNSDDAVFWTTALEVQGYRSDVLTPEKTEQLKPEELKRYNVICLFEAARPSFDLWTKLARYVREGGGLFVIPPPKDDRAEREAYNRNRDAQQLLPAELKGIVTTKTETPALWTWKQPGAVHPLLAPFLEWRRTRNVDFQAPEKDPAANRYWDLAPRQGSVVIIRHTDEEKRPALLEQTLGQGRTLVISTTLDIRREVLFKGKGERPWHNYWEGSFGLVLVDKVCRYLAGDVDIPRFDFQCGQSVPVPLPPGPLAPPYTLQGPGVNGVVLNPAKDGENEETSSRMLPVNRLLAPGNYTVYDGQAVRIGAFSVQVQPEEWQLERVPVDDIEAVLGKDTVLPLDRNMSLKEALQQRRQPLELLPWLMLLLLVFLVGENLLSNRRRSAAPAPGVEPPRPTFREFQRRIGWLALWMFLGMVVGAGLGSVRSGERGAAAGACAFILLGAAHALTDLARFGPRDSAILGGLLGSMAGVVVGGMLLTRYPLFDGPVAVVIGALAGGVLFAFDGWLLGVRRAAKEQV